MTSTNNTNNKSSSSFWLLFPVKVPPRYDLVKPLASWLDNSELQTEFKGDDPMQFVLPKPEYSSTACRSELLRLAALRNCLSESLLDVSSSGANNNVSHGGGGDGTMMELLVSEAHSQALKDSYEYHATLLAFERQGFPSDISSKNEERNGINLTWKGAFAKAQQEVHYSLIWDRACTMWNIASLECTVAASSDLSTKEGCKAAIAKCQSAASCLTLLKDLIDATGSIDTYETVDLSQPMISFWETLLLAQGQVCIYKLANLGDTVRQHSVLAYLAKGAAVLYNTALQQAQDPRLQSEVPKPSQKWAAHVKIQSMIHSAKAEFHCAVDHRMQQQWGLELARLRQCGEYLDSCLEFITSAESSLRTTILPEVQALAKLAKDRLFKANAENLAIYQESIPRTVSEIPPKQMVKINPNLPETMLVPQVKLFQNIR
jgi:hypothetical protein